MGDPSTTPDPRARDASSEKGVANDTRGIWPRLRNAMDQDEGTALNLEPTEEPFPMAVPFGLVMNGDIEAATEPSDERGMQFTYFSL